LPGRDESFDFVGAADQKKDNSIGELKQNAVFKTSSSREAGGRRIENKSIPFYRRKTFLGS